jgi:O-antigen chain-terminating methyltransferase
LLRALEGELEQLVPSVAVLRESFVASQQVADSHSQELRDVQAAVSVLRTGLEKLELEVGHARAEVGIQLARQKAIGDENLEQLKASQSREIAGITAEAVTIRSAIGELGESLRTARLEGRRRDRDFRRFVNDVQSGTRKGEARSQPHAAAPMFPSEIKREEGFDYFVFEDLYRGDESLIRRRQEEYLQYFQGRDDVLDVGCGRGEFLELLRDNNIRAKGVELGIDQYLLCKEKGLDVTNEDLFAYLESLPDQSLGGLFSAQVIEHLTAGDQLRCVGLAYQKTKVGSPVIFETINAQCVWAVMRNFFLDPTHVRPMHPETLKFAMECAKFRDVTLLFSSPMSDFQLPALELLGQEGNLEEFNLRLKYLNDLLFGNQDYSVLGWR